MSEMALSCGDSCGWLSAKCPAGAVSQSGSLQSLHVTWPLGYKRGRQEQSFQEIQAEAVSLLVPQPQKSQNLTCTTFYCPSKSLSPAQIPGEGIRAPAPWREEQHRFPEREGTDGGHLGESCLRK